MADAGEEDGPRFGRRAGGGGGAPTTGWGSPSGEADEAPPPRRGKPASSWVDEPADMEPSASSGAGRSGRGAGGGDELEGIQELHDEHPAEADTDLTMQVARAPTGPTRKVQSLGELNTQARLTGLSAAGLGTEADLALLTATLADPSQVKEADEVWDPDTVLQEVAQQIAADKEDARGAGAPGDE